MADELSGKRIAILAADGVEQVELEQPRQAVEDAGASAELLSLEAGEIQTVESDINPTDKIPVDKAVSDASPDDYDVRGRTLTSYPSIRTDIRNAGGKVVDEEVVVDQGLVSSRDPDDLPAFCAKLVEEFAEGAHDVHPEGATA
jgi:protease I